MIIGSNETNIHANLLFLMGDIMESLLMDVRQLLLKQNCELRHEAKREFNTAIHSLRKMKGAGINGCHIETQIDFGNDSDRMYEFIKLLIDRCGADDRLMLQLYDHIAAMPSKCGMKNLDRSVFNGIGGDYEEDHD